jgi:hypothetical protein
VESSKKGAIVFRTGIFATIASLLFGCASQPLEPTADVKRVAQIKIGQSAAEVRAIMGRRGGLFNYSLQAGGTSEAWIYADHFNDMCLMVAYDANDRVTAVASIEREKGPGRVALPGGCR